MSAVSETAAAVASEEIRDAKECLRGFTPFQRGDVLVAKITPCFENGKIVIANIGRKFGFGSTEFHVVRPDARYLDVRYLLHCLRQPHVRLQGQRRMTGSAGQRRVPAHFLSTFEIPLCTLPEQQRIAGILDAADALRATRREALAQLDTLLQSTFLDMFGDPVTNPMGQYGTFDSCFPDSVVGFRSDVPGMAEYVQGLFWFFQRILDQQATQVAQKNHRPS
jgi:type I restriction enzyme, S subunit